MRLRPLLAATAASTMLVAGLTSGAAQSDPVPSPAASGALVAWGEAGDPAAAAALSVPADLTSMVVDIAVTDRATAVVTADGRLRVWGESGAPEVDQAPTDVTDAVAVSLSTGSGAVVREDGTIRAWGTPALVAVPTIVVTSAYAIAVSMAGSTGYYIPSNVGFKTGTVQTWGAPPPFDVPSRANPALEVSATPSHALSLKTDGTAAAWGDPGVPSFNTVPALGGVKVTQITTGSGANGVVLADGTIRIWGPAVPVGQPDFSGTKVISLGLGDGTAGAVTADGVVHMWGSNAAVNAVPASLDGRPVASVAMGAKHAAAVLAYRELAPVSISGIPEVGQTLTAVQARYTISPTATTGQWYAGIEPIKGETGTTLTVDDSLLGSTISYRASASRGGATRSSEWAPFGPINRAESTTILTVSPATAAAGNTRTATATVARTGGTASGTVTFTAGTSTRVVVLDQGKATWRLPRLAIGSHSVTAFYSGSPSTAPSTAIPANLTSTKATSTVRAKARSTATKVRIAVIVETNEDVSPVGQGDRHRRGQEGDRASGLQRQGGRGPHAGQARQAHRPGDLRRERQSRWL